MFSVGVAEGDDGYERHHLVDLTEYGQTDCRYYGWVAL